MVTGPTGACSGSPPDGQATKEGGLYACYRPPWLAGRVAATPATNNGARSPWLIALVEGTSEVLVGGTRAVWWRRSCCQAPQRASDLPSGLDTAMLVVTDQPGVHQLIPGRCPRHSTTWYPVLHLGLGELPWLVGKYLQDVVPGLLYGGRTL